MASSNTIREFLIGLGVDINTSDINRFVVTIQGMTKEVERFAFRLAAMTSALQAAVVKTADALETLYYIAQRGVTTVSNLRSWQYALAQVGLTAADANASLEGMAMALRVNPGNESLLRFLGVATRDMRGNMRDTMGIMGDFLGRLSKMPFYIAAQYAAMFGINERTLFMLLRDFRELAVAAQHWKELARATGVDLEVASKVSRDFMNTLRETGEIIELIWIKIATVLIQRFQPQLERFNRFLLAHAKDIESYALEVVTSVLDTGDAIVRMLPQLDALVRKTLGWKSALDLVASVIIYRIFGPIGLALFLLEKVVAALPELEKNRPDTPTGPHSSEVFRFLGKPDPAHPDALQRFFNDLGNALVQGIKKAFEQGLTMPGVSTQSGEGFDPRFIHPASYSPGEDGPGPATIAVRQNNPGNLRWAPGADSSGGFARFNSPLEGFMALRRQLLLYAQRGLDSVSSIIAKYAPSSENNTGAYIQSLAKALGVSPSAHLDLQNPATMAKLMAGITRIESGYNPWSTSLINQAARAAPLGQGRGNVIINQRTNIHAHGSEPHETARETARAQDRVNATLVRNFRSAVIA